MALILERVDVQLSPVRLPSLNLQQMSVELVLETRLFAEGLEPTTEPENAGFRIRKSSQCLSWEDQAIVSSWP